jgi:hypothetical protein
MQILLNIITAYESFIQTSLSQLLIRHQNHRSRCKVSASQTTQATESKSRTLVTDLRAYESHRKDTGNAFQTATANLDQQDVARRIAAYFEATQTELQFVGSQLRRSTSSSSPYTPSLLRCPVLRLFSRKPDMQFGNGAGFFGFWNRKGAHNGWNGSGSQFGGGMG